MNLAPLLLAACVAAAPTPAHAGRKAPKIVVDELPDGTDLIVAPMPAAGNARASVRLVIRSGGDDDPPGKAGLAHLLEHLVFHGTYQEPEGAFFEKAWAAGANLNAYTSSNWTTYVLDAYASSFDALVPGFLTMMTSPALPFSSFDRERGVVGAEHSDRPNQMSLLFAFDQQAFPSANGGVTVIGTEKSRASIALEDVEAFYAAHYVPENAILVVTGDVTVEQVKRAAAAGLRWPPRLAPRPKDGVEVPNVPSQAKGLSPITVTIHGRLVDGASPGACHAAAGLLELRLRKRVLADEAMIADVGAVCHRQRGHDFVLSYVVTSSPESSLVPAWMRAVAATLPRTPASAAEKALVEQRRRVAIARAAARPDVLADALMFALARDDWTAQDAVAAVARPPALAWGEVPRLSRAGDDALVELHFSRFEH